MDTSATATKLAPTMSPRTRELMSAFELYEKLVSDPNDKERRMVTFLRGRIHWRHPTIAAGARRRFTLRIYEEI